MNVLFGVLLAAGASAVPSPMGLVYEHTGVAVRAEGAHFVRCDEPLAAQVDLCVPAGTWVALCEGRMIAGPLVLDTRSHDAPTIAGCSQTPVLFYGAKPTASVAIPVADDPIHAHYTDSAFTAGGSHYRVVLNAQTARLEIEVRDDKGSIRKSTMNTAVIAGALPVARTTGLYLEAEPDLDGDGFANVLVHGTGVGWTREYESRWGDTAGALVSLSDPPRVIATGLSAPMRLWDENRPGPDARDVLDWLSRSEGCEHWAGEEPYDAERKREIDSGLSGCGALPAERKALLRAHRKDPSIQRALKE